MVGWAWFKVGMVNPPYFSNHMVNEEIQIILVMISNGEDGIILQLKKKKTLLRGIPSKTNCDFYCLNSLHLFRAKNKLESYKYVSENKDFYGAVIPSDDTKILEFNQY